MAQLKDTTIIGDLSVSGNHTVTGNIAVSGTVDCRDASVDGLLAAKEIQVNSAAKWVWDSTNQCLKVVFN